MELTVYGPQGAAEKQELERRAGMVYARAAERYLQGIECPAEERDNLFEEVKQLYRKQHGAGTSRPCAR